MALGQAYRQRPRTVLSFFPRHPCLITSHVGRERGRRDRDALRRVLQGHDPPRHPAARRPARARAPRHVLRRAHRRRREACPARGEPRPAARRDSEEVRGRGRADDGSVAQGARYDVRAEGNGQEGGRGRGAGYCGGRDEALQLGVNDLGQSVHPIRTSTEPLLSCQGQAWKTLLTVSHRGVYQTLLAPSSRQPPYVSGCNSSGYREENFAFGAALVIRTFPM